MISILRNIKQKLIRFRRGAIVQKLYRVVFLLLGRLPKKSNLVVFESFHGKQYSDSPRAIYEYMKENKMPYVMYWMADRRHINAFDKLEDVQYVKRLSPKWIFLMARAKYWISNARLPLWLPKPKDTIYVQTWHGTPLKRLGADIEEVHMPGTNTEKYKENFLFEASKWDYLVSPNAYSTKIFKRAFGFNKKVIESGYPRNDFLINNNDMETIARLKKKCELPLDKKVILYAPTWRDNQFYAKGSYKFDLQMDLAQMKEHLGDEYVIALRLHYLVAENLDLTGYEDFVFDFSSHEDIRELYLIGDLLITDYSSVFFDYANLKRPMIFFVYDIEDYRDKLRGFYFDFEQKAPGPLVKTTDEIIHEIRKVNENGFTPSENIEEFYNRFCYLEDGHASARVVGNIFKK
ncbi:CDP-glycerol:poly(glycerophosphate) glycerophosphotransferase [Bacillus freudenreichii]|nr:CDP-glycerol:poly(glycerophosphate) glycerophosphotransferase [Bacillus freudenreichii]